jgi:hypothetical protein
MPGAMPYRRSWGGKLACHGGEDDGGSCSVVILAQSGAEVEDMHATSACHSCAVQSRGCHGGDDCRGLCAIAVFAHCVVLTRLDMGRPPPLERCIWQWWYWRCSTTRHRWNVPLRRGLGNSYIRLWKRALRVSTPNIVLHNRILTKQLTKTGVAKNPP